MFGSATYLVLLITWAAPVVALHWLVGGDVLWARRRTVGGPALIGGLYLSLADRFALGNGIWQISPDRSTGLLLGGLPLEEALFFIVTSLMVAQSVVLLTDHRVTRTLVLGRLRALPTHLWGRRQSLIAAYRRGLAWSSLAAVLASLVALVEGNDSPLTAPAGLVMDLTPLPVASWLLNQMGSLVGPLGLLGGFAVYLGLAGLSSLATAGGPPGWLLAGAIATLVAGWTSTTGGAVPGVLLGGFPLLAAWQPTFGSRSPLPFARGRRALLGYAPLAAAAVLCGLWSLGRLGREIASRGSGSPLFRMTEPVPRVAGFPVAGQAAEVTPRENFYRVSKNLEDPAVDVGRWRLRVQGEVAAPAILDLEALLAMPRQDTYVTLECVSNPVGGSLMSNGLWSGVALSSLIQQVAPSPQAAWVVFRGLDGHYEALPRAALDADGALVAYALNGHLLDRRHGFPARLVAPGRYGFKQVKWLDQIQLVSSEQHGYWSGRGWTQLAPIRTAARIDLVRAEPEGRLVAGVAVGGARGVSHVQVRRVGADTVGPWVPAQLHHPPIGSAAWVQWRAHLPGSGGGFVQARACDGLGIWQDETPEGPFPAGASGLHQSSVPS